jgi:hypothetical protein
MAASEVEETLGWEAEQRPRAAIAALLAGALTLASNVLLTVGLRDFPVSDVLEAFDAALRGEVAPLRAEQVAFIDDHLLVLLASAIAGALGFLGMALALLFLYRATAARRPEIPRFVRILAVAGPVTAAVGSLMAMVARSVASAKFVSDGGDGSVEAARDALSPAAAQAGQLLALIGTFGLAMALGFIALNAMRAGLLTRFLGVLGVIAGVLWIIPFDQLAIVRSLWWMLLGVLLASTARLPLAWQTGRAEPWPTQQQLREAREAEKRAASGEPAPAPAEEKPVGDAPHPATAKRKRKRRS